MLNNYEIIVKMPFQIVFGGLYHVMAAGHFNYKKTNTKWFRLKK